MVTVLFLTFPKYTLDNFPHKGLFSCHWLCFLLDQGVHLESANSLQLSPSLYVRVSSFITIHRKPLWPIKSSKWCHLLSPGRTWLVCSSRVWLNSDHVHILAHSNVLGELAPQIFFCLGLSMFEWNSLRTRVCTFPLNTVMSEAWWGQSSSLVIKCTDSFFSLFLNQESNYTLKSYMTLRAGQIYFLLVSG